MNRENRPGKLLMPQDSRDSFKELKHYWEAISPETPGKLCLNFVIYKYGNYNVITNCILMFDTFSAIYCEEKIAFEKLECKFGNDVIENRQ